MTTGLNRRVFPVAFALLLSSCVPYERLPDLLDAGVSVDGGSDDDAGPGAIQDGGEAPAGDGGPGAIQDGGVAPAGDAGTIVVTPAGSPEASGAALAAACSDARRATSNSPVVIQVQPGTYDLGTTVIFVPPYVTLLGSGASGTVVRSSAAGEAGFRLATIILEDHSTLMNLTVENVSNSWASAIMCEGSELGEIAPATHIQVSGVTARIPLAQSWRSVIFCTHPVGSIEDSVIEGTATAGVHLWGFESPPGANLTGFTLRKTRIELSGGERLYGANSRGGGLFDQVTISVSGATLDSAALEGTSITVRDSVLSGSSSANGRAIAFDGPANSVTGSVLVGSHYGVYSGGATISVSDGSRVEAPAPVHVFGASTVSVSDSVLAGGANTGSVTCQNVTDESGNSAGSDVCPQ